MQYKTLDYILSIPKTPHDKQTKDKATNIIINLLYTKENKCQLSVIMDSRYLCRANSRMDYMYHLHTPIYTNKINFQKRYSYQSLKQNRERNKVSYVVYFY